MSSAGSHAPTAQAMAFDCPDTLPHTCHLGAPCLSRACASVRGCVGGLGVIVVRVSLSGG
jgi:hypothetical protein